MNGAANVIGVTGLPCAGKSLAAGLIASGAVDGVPGVLLKADDIGHEILLRADVVAALRGRFGDAVVDAGSPAAVRAAVAERVFSDPAALAWLEGLVHPLVVAEAGRRCAEAASGSGPGTRAVVEAALLFAAGMEARCDFVLIIESDFDVRLARAAARGWDENELRRREERLVPLFDAAPRGAGNDTLARVDNSGSIGDLRDGLRAALRRAAASL